MGLIKSIFGFIGGIFKAIAGLVGLGKKSEFYMELNEADSGVEAAASAPAAKAEPKPVAQPAAVPAPAAPPAAVVSAPVPAPVATASAAPATPVISFAANYLTSAGGSLPSRRRPGPSLSPFMDMAKQVKPR